MVDRVDENTGLTREGLGMERVVKNVLEMGNTNRRALRDIRNLVGVPQYPCAITKKGFQDMMPIDKNNPQGVINMRPMTRSFAASLTNKPQPSHQKNARLEQIGRERQKRPHSSALSSNGSDEYSAIDVDDFRSSDDLPLAMAEEMQNMVNCEAEYEEIEMEDMEMEVTPDIDSCDTRNPLAVVEYIDDIYSFYRKAEESTCVSANYMLNQYDINEKMRAILIDWLIEVHYKFELMDETLFLTVNIIDRFLERQTIVRKKLQLVGVTAMLLACKYEEVSVPVVEDLILISDRAYSRAEVLEMERLMVNTLEFNMSVPTAYVFMRRFLKAANSDGKLDMLSFFMIELCLVEYQMLKFRPSLLAAAAIYTAQCTLQGSKSWARTVEFHTNYCEEQLRECSRMMVEFHRNAAVGKLTGVHRKYSTFKFGCAAKSEPALFLLETQF